MPNPSGMAETPEIRVLVVDDNQIFLRATTELLQRHPELVVVDTVSEGEKALIRAQFLRPQAVLVGLDTPVLMGLDTISRLRMILPEMAIIALTMLSDDASRRAVLSAGADEIITKASLSTDLIPAIQQAVQTREVER